MPRKLTRVPASYMALRMLSEHGPCTRAQLMRLMTRYWKQRLEAELIRADKFGVGSQMVLRDAKRRAFVAVAGALAHKTVVKVDAPLKKRFVYAVMP